MAERKTEYFSEEHAEKAGVSATRISSMSSFMPDAQQKISATVSGFLRFFSQNIKFFNAHCEASIEMRGREFTRAIDYFSKGKAGPSDYDVNLLNGLFLDSVYFSQEIYVRNGSGAPQEIIDLMARVLSVDMGLDEKTRNSVSAVAHSALNKITSKFMQNPSIQSIHEIEKSIERCIRKIDGFEDSLEEREKSVAELRRACKLPHNLDTHK